MKEIKVIAVAMFVVFLTTAYQATFYSLTNKEVNVELLKTSQIIPWGVEKVIDSRLETQSSENVVRVAVMDSGIDFDHPDFVGSKINIGYNALSPMELPMDDYGHGTLVSGVIVAQDNELGIIGIAPEAELFPVKVLNKFGKGKLTDVVDGIEWCIENKMQIINMSFAVPENKIILKQAIKKATSNGIIIVASVSNEGGKNVGYPAAYEDVISVVAVDNNFKICKNSSNGKVDFSAPGVDILSTSKNKGYEKFTGASLAAPHITGIVIKILQDRNSFGLQSDKKICRDDIYEVLKNLSIDLGSEGKDDIFGEHHTILCT